MNKPQLCSFSPAFFETETFKTYVAVMTKAKQSGISLWPDDLYSVVSKNYDQIESGRNTSFLLGLFNSKDPKTMQAFEVQNTGNDILLSTKVLRSLHTMATEAVEKKLTTVKSSDETSHPKDSSWDFFPYKMPPGSLLDCEGTEEDYQNYLTVWAQVPCGVGLIAAAAEFRAKMQVMKKVIAGMNEQNPEPLSYYPLMTTAIQKIIQEIGPHCPRLDA